MYWKPVSKCMLQTEVCFPLHTYFMHLWTITQIVSTEKKKTEILADYIF